MQQAGPRTVTLVLGGVRSGKSRFALQQACGFARVCFVATATASDPEMTEKVRRHRAERPNHWETIEEPLALGDAIRAAGARSDAVLVDCLTIFAANLLALERPQASQHVDRLLEAIVRTSASVILVSNEVGSGVVPPYESGRQFRDLLGELNQKVAAVADTAVLLVAGLPLVLKGTLEGCA